MTTAIEWTRTIGSVLAPFAWPGTVVVVAVIFRSEVKTLLGKITKIGVGPVAAEFQDAAQRTTSALLTAAAVELPSATVPDVEPEVTVRVLLSEYFADRAEDNPKNAVLEAYLAVERWFDALLTQNEISVYEGFQRRGVTEMCFLATRTGILPAVAVDLVDGLTTMRQAVLEVDGAQVPASEARTYLTLTDAVLSQLHMWADFSRSQRRPDAK